MGAVAQPRRTGAAASALDDERLPLRGGDVDDADVGGARAGVRPGGQGPGRPGALRDEDRADADRAAGLLQEEPLRDGDPTGS